MEKRTIYITRMRDSANPVRGRVIGITAETVSERNDRLNAKADHDAIFHRALKARELDAAHFESLVDAAQEGGDRD